MTLAEWFEVHCLYNCLQLEIFHLKGCKHPSCFSTIKERWGFKGSREEVKKQLFDWVQAQPMDALYEEIFRRRDRDKHL